MVISLVGKKIYTFFKFSIVKGFVVLLQTGTLFRMYSGIKDRRGSSNPVILKRIKWMDVLL